MLIHLYNSKIEDKMPKLLLNQRGKRVFMNVYEYSLLTRSSKDYTSLINSLLNSLSRTRGLLHVRENKQSKRESFASILGIESVDNSYEVLSQDIDSDLLLKESIGVLIVPDGVSSELFFLYPEDSITIRDRSGCVIDQFPA